MLHLHKTTTELNAFKNMNASHSNQMQKSAVNYMKLHLNVDFKSNQPKFLSEEIDAV